MRDRGYDLAQCVDAGAGYSEGLSANARVSKLLQFGFGGYRGIYWAGLKGGLLDVWQEERTEFGLGPFYVHELFRADGCQILDVQHPLFGDPGYRQVSWDVTHLTDRGWLDIGFTFNCVLVGFDLSFKPAEFADFVAGFAHKDLLLDDILQPGLEDLEARLMSEDANVRAAAVRALRIRTRERMDYRFWTAPRELPEEQQRAIDRWRDWLKVNGLPPADDRS